MATNIENTTITGSDLSLETDLNHYSNNLEGYDEMWGVKDAEVHSHWRQLINGITQLGGDELERRRTDARRLLRENGVTYHIYSDPKGQKRTWQLDPIPLLINSQDWAAISEGLKQRARLLNMVLRDIYGPRRLIKEGLIPAELIYAQQGFLRACDQVQMKDIPPLLFYAADLARGPDGRMWVLGDRSQAPSGAGYTLETRMAMTRVMADEFRRTHVHRLSIFFRHFRSTLAALMPHRKDDPRVVILTPGPHNETYFEHAYLASYLGYSLVQGDDLTVRGGKVWMKSLDGLKQVDIIVRRVDDTFCDPLELREDSHLGVPGLLQAARLGNVIIANPLGSSVLESPAFMPFLPNIAKQWLGEELLLPTAATWWCGQKKEREYVLANLKDLVIKPIDRRRPTVFPSQLNEKQVQALKSQILTEPHLYVGQQVLSCSTAPSLREGKIVPRRVLLRTFLTAYQDDYDVMPGGLTRVAQDEGALFVTNQTGGLSKDTWILAAKPVHQASLWPSIPQMEGLLAGEGVLPSRSGENLFWVGRYTERSEGLIRLIRTTLNKLADYDDYQDESDQVVLNHLLESLTHFTRVYPGFTGKDKDVAEKRRRPRHHIMDMVLNNEHRSGLIGTVNALLQSAYNVRDLWSSDTWRVVDDIDENLQYLNSNDIRFPALQTELDSLLASLMAFSSQTQESMPHEHGWYLLNIGRRMERAIQLICFFRTCFVESAGEVPEHLMLETALTNHESLITHRRRYRSVQHILTVLDLMLLDMRHPRSLAYQVDKIMSLMEKLPQPSPSHHLSREQRLILQASTEIKLAEVEKLAKINDEAGIRRNLSTLLDSVERRLEKVSELLHQRYFTHTQHVRQLAPTKLELPG